MGKVTLEWDNSMDELVMESYGVDTDDGLVAALLQQVAQRTVTHSVEKAGIEYDEADAIARRARREALADAEEIANTNAVKITGKR